MMNKRKEHKLHKINAGYYYDDLYEYKKELVFRYSSKYRRVRKIFMWKVYNRFNDNLINEFKSLKEAIGVLW